MTTEPPPYPRVPHLVAGRGSRDDLVLGESEVADLMADDVVIEEKVDGANVTLWIDDSQVRCALRSGVGAMDRAGQLGPLRAWLAAHDEALRTILGPVDALYAEWMFVSHTVVYERLPTYLVVLDVWRADDGFASIDDRDAACRATEMVTPPMVWRGVPGTVDRVEHLFGPSAWSSAPMEGLVVRRVAPGEPRLAKLVRTGFDRLDDEAWQRGRPRNRLTEEASWR